MFLVATQRGREVLDKYTDTPGCIPELLAFWLVNIGKEVEVHGSNAGRWPGVIVLVATRPFPRMGLVGKSRLRQRAVGDPR